MSDIIRYRGCDLIPYGTSVAVWSGDHLLFCAPSADDAKDRLERPDNGADQNAAGGAT